MVADPSKIHRGEPQPILLHVSARYAANDRVSGFTDDWKSLESEDRATQGKTASFKLTGMTAEMRIEFSCRTNWRELRHSYPDIYIIYIAAIAR